MLITYILFLTKLQKGKPCGMDLPLLEKQKKDLDLFSIPLNTIYIQRQQGST